VPTKEELSEQLALTQKLAAATEAMARSIAQVETSYDSQIATVQKLTKAIDELKNTDFSNLNGTKLDGLKKELQSTSKSVTTLTGRMKDLGLEVGKNLPTSAAVGVTAMNSFAKSVGSVVSLSKDVGTFFGNLISGVSDLDEKLSKVSDAIKGLDVSSINDTKFNKLNSELQNVDDQLKNLTNSSDQIKQVANDVGKEFTTSASASSSVLEKLIENVRNVAIGSDDAAKSLSGLGNPVNDVIEQLNSMSDSLKGADIGSIDIGEIQKEFKDSSDVMRSTSDELKTLIDSLNKNLPESVNAGVSALNEFSASVQDITSQNKDVVDFLGNLMNSSSTIDSINQLTASIDALIAKDFSKINTVKFDMLNGQMKLAKNGVDGFSKRVDQFVKNIHKKFPMAIAAASGAISGFIQGIENVVALGKGITGFFASFIVGAGSVAASIIAIPFKMFNGLIDMAAAAGGGIDELAVALEKLRGEMGDLKGPGTHAVLEASQSLKGFSDTGLSAWRVFGTLAERIEAVTKLAVGMGASFGVVRKEFEDNGGALLGFQKGLGLSEEGMKAITDRSITMGAPLSKTLLDITKQTTALGKAFDIDQKLIGKDMQKAAIDVKHFGAVSVKEIGQASVYARKLGVELDKITGALDAFETLDSAAENAAKLGQAFGVNVDAFKMMEAQNPAEALDMLRKSFKDAGVDSSNFTRQQAKLLAQTTNLDEATVRQAFSMKNQGVNLDDIKKKSEAAEKKTMSQADAMSKLADSIERMVKSGGGQAGGFWEQFVKGFLGGIQASKEFRDIIWNIKRSLQLVYFEGVRLGKAFVEMFPGVKDFLGGIADFFKPEKFKKLAGGVVDILKDWMKDLQDPNGKASFSGLMDKLREKFFDFFDSQSPSGKKLVEGFKTIIKTIGRVLADGIKWAAARATEGVRFIVDLLSGKVNLSAIGAAGQGGLGFLIDVFAPIIASLKNAWTIFAPAMWDLVKTLYKKLKKFLLSDEVMSEIKSALPELALVLFGPAFGRALLAAFTNTLVKSTGSLLSGTLNKVFGKISKQASTAAAAANAANAGGDATQDFEGIKKVGEGAKKGIDGSKNWGIQDAVKLGAKLVAIAAALAIGGVLMAYAIVQMKSALSSGGIKTPEDAYAPMMVLAGMVLSVVPVVLAAKAASKASPGDLLKMGAVALAVGAAGIAFAWAISIMNSQLKKGGIDSAESAGVPLLILAAMIASMVPVVLGMKVVSSSASPSEVVKGGLVIAAAAAIVGVTGAMIGGLLSLINPAKLSAAGNFMMSMSLVFLAMVPLIIASMVIGALASGPQAIALAAAAVGLGVIGAAVGEMALIAVGIVQVLAKLPIDESFQTKIDAFLGIMKAIQALTDSMVKVIGMLMPGLMDFLTLTPVTKKIDAARNFMISMIGQPGGGGLIGIIDTVMKVVDQIKGAGPEFASAANVFASIMQATSDVMKAMTPPPDFFEAQTSFINVVAPWTGLMASGNASKYMGSMVDSLLNMLGDGENSGIIKAVKMLGAISIPNVEKARAIAGIISAISGLMKALTPDHKVIEAMNESAAGVSYAWGLFKMKDTSDTGKQLKELMGGQAEAAKSAIDAITNGPIKAVIENASSFSKENLEGIKVVGDLMNTVVNIINAVGSNLKNASTVKIDGSKIESIWQSVPDVVSVMKGIGDQIPILMGAMTKAVNAVPSGKEFMGRLEAMKSLFSMIVEIPKLSKGLAEASKAGGGSGDIKNIDPLMSAISTVETFLARLISDNSGGSPIAQIVSYIKQLGAAGLGSAGDSIEKTITSINVLFKSIGEMGTSITTISSVEVDPSTMDATSKLMSTIGNGLYNMAPYFDLITSTINQIKVLKGSEGKIGEVNSLLTSTVNLALSIQKIMNSPAVKDLNGEDTIDSLSRVASFLQNVTSSDSSLSTISQASQNMAKYASSMKNNGIVPALVAVSEMVTAANRLNEALGSGANKLDISAKLGPLATAMGLGSKAQYTIKNKDVLITVNMNVTMNAGEVEKAIFTSKGSFIRQRLDFLTDDAGASPQILQGNPYTQAPGAPNPISKGGSSGGGR
jgi:hypothetical protein